MSAEHLDVVVVGAGMAGIDAGYHVLRSLPGRSYAILEARSAIGGTWDLFRYPGIRSDSDMYTFGFPFRPWRGDAIADGASILAYVQDTAREFGIDRHVRYGHEVVRADWSGADALWRVEAVRDGTPVHLTCRFLYLCVGYYDYAAGYTPDFPGAEAFRGRLVHPQSWPGELDCAGRRVVVIGSGATAVTLVPALAARGARVTMLQRSPSYVVAWPAKDRLAAALARVLPDRAAFAVTRWRNVLTGLALYRLARKYPATTRRLIVARAARQLGPGCDARVHFTPSYDPWDQRLCLVPDADLFRAVRAQAAEVVTDEVATFTAGGIRLLSGRELAADVVVTATGLRLKLAGGVALSVDGAPVDLSRALTYKGCMLSDVPNLAYAVGYTNAAWTLKCDLTSAFVCRVLAHMDRRGYASCAPVRESGVGEHPIIDLDAGYVRRSIAAFPKQGDRKPWRLHQNYAVDTAALRFGRIEDGTLRFARAAPAA